MKNLIELHQEFMDQKRFSERLRASTLRGYEQSFHVLCLILPRLTVDQLTTETMNKFFMILETRERKVGNGKLVRGVLASTVLTYRSKLNTFFEWLMQKNDERSKPYLDINPFASIKYPEVIHDDRRWLGHEEVEKIIVAVSFNVKWINEFARKRNIVAILTMLFSGIRVGELTGLKYTDIDLERRLLTVRGETSKSKRHRILMINPILWRALLDYLEERKKRKLTTSSLLASASKDESFTPDGVKNLIERVSKAAGVKFHAHSFRHTFAVNMSLLGTDIYHIKELLGHKSIDMTTRYLRHLPATRVGKDINALTLENLA